MPQYTLKTKTEHCIETQITPPSTSSTPFADDGAPFVLIGKKEFTEAFLRRYPDTTINPGRLWDEIMGNYPEDEQWQGDLKYSGIPAGEQRNPLHPDVHFLTEEACQKIIAHYHHFQNGIDYQHLPGGFLLKKNPNENNIRNILHFSDFVAKNSSKVSPLAVTLLTTDQITQDNEEEALPCEGAQAKWYAFLLSKMSGWEHLLCRKKELNNAFVYFSNLVSEKGLDFYEPDFSHIKENIHPIVLMGRWATVLCNKNLASEALPDQWQHLLEIPLETSYGAIRAITDFARTDHPCGFLLPDMLPGVITLGVEHLPEVDGYKPCYVYTGLNTVPRPDRIRESNCDELACLGRLDSTSEQATEPQERNTSDFWRYLAFQNKRHSISFYKKAIATLQKINFCKKVYNVFNQAIWENMLFQLLAMSTTGAAHSANTPLEEAHDLATWEKLCKFVSEIDSKTVALKTLNKIPFEGNYKFSFIEKMKSIKGQPNLDFLYSLTRYCQKLFTRVTTGEVFTTITKSIAGQGDGRIKEISEWYTLITKVEKVSSVLKEDFNLGARFYFVDGILNARDLVAYVDLQDTILSANDADLGKIFSAHVSTFGIQTKKEWEQIKSWLPGFSATVKNDLTFCLTIFKDITSALNKAILKKIFQDISHFHNENNDSQRMFNMLDYLEKHYQDKFPEGYFPQKRKEIQDNLHGLNESQKIFLKGYRFSLTSERLITQLASSLVMKAPTSESGHLKKLYDWFFSLSELLMPDDFELFLQRLASLRDDVPDVKTLSRLLKLICEQKSLSAFNIVFLRNKITPCENQQQVLYKINAFIENYRAILEKSWKDIGLVSLQETLATLYLKSDINTLSSKKVLSASTLSPLESTPPATTSSASDDTSDQPPSAYLQGVDAINKNIHAMYTVITAQLQAHDPLILAIHHLPPAIPVNQLITVFMELNVLFPPEEKQNRLTFYSLVSHFSKCPQALIDLSECLHQTNDAEKKRFLYTFISNLKDSDACFDNIKTLLTLTIQNNDHHQQLVQYCSAPPYPPINDAIQWLNNGDFETQYAAFSLTPFGERRLAFAFDPARFDEQARQFKGVDNTLFSAEVKETLHQHLEENRQKSITALQEEVREIQLKPTKTNEDKQKLMCLCIEFLARTTYQSDENDDKTSQEFNTTQVMTLYAMLTQDNPKIFNQIDTGEGKSRIMMVLAAYKALEGKTVDFITSNMPLAERDFFSYSAFFTVLGIPTSLISLKTPKQLYQKSGVNFSDDAQLLLLRNRSDVEQSSFDYLNEDKKARCLLADEVDHLYYNKRQNAYNYASRSKKLTQYLWIYPLLVRFVSRKLKSMTEKMLFQDKETLLHDFIKYVSLHENNLAHQDALASIHESDPKQLILWLQSACTALHMENNKDYVVTGKEDTQLYLERDHEGMARYTRKVMVLDNGRPVEGSSFAEGVHQCLCVIENQRAGQDAFLVMPENEMQRSSYSTTFMDQYENIYGVSGTTRSEAPSSSAEINRDNYHYLITPREKRVIRDDKNSWVAKDELQQIQFIKHEMMAAMKQGKSCLLFCKDDSQSARFYEILKKDPELKRLVSTWQRVHSLTPSEEERKATQQAGQPGCITLSTPGMSARGVDIRAKHKYVLSTSVLPYEDEIQAKGRSGRFGRPGDYRMILNLSDEDCPLAGRTYNIANTIDKAQKDKAILASFQEEVSSIYAKFLEEVHQLFFKEYQSTDNEPTEKLAQLEKWQMFLGRMQTDWEIKRKELIAVLDEGNKEAFLSSFKAFSEKWEKEVPVKNQHATLYNEAYMQSVYQGLTARQKFFTHAPKKITMQSAYDVADDGQARIYSSLFAQTKATLQGERPLFANFKAWREGRGTLFPDLQAALKGDRPLFANLRAAIARLIQAIMEWIKNRRAPHAHGLSRGALATG